MGSEVAYRGLAWLIWLYRVPCFLLCLTATSPLSLSDIHFCPARSYCIITPQISHSVLLRPHKSTCSPRQSKIMRGVSPWTSETSLSQCAWLSSETPEGRPRCSPECSPFSAGVDDAPECHTHETGSRCGQHGLLNATSQRLMGERKYLQKKWDLQV